MKNLIRKLHGIPLSLQQLLHSGSSLDDTAKLEAPVDLQLVLLSVSNAEQGHEIGNELRSACQLGDLRTAQLLLEAGADKNLQDDYGETLGCC